MSSIEVALTLLHEGLHVQIYQKLLLIHGPAKLNNLNFPGLIKAYQDYAQGGVQHQYIAQNYITSSLLHSEPSITTNLNLNITRL